MDIPEPLKSFPGFRSGTPWKMVVASLFYLFVIVIIMIIALGSPSTPIEKECAGEVSATAMKGYSDRVDWTITNNCNKSIVVTKLQWYCSGSNLNTGERINMMDSTVSDFWLEVPANSEKTRGFNIYSDNLYDSWVRCSNEGFSWDILKE